MREDVTLPPQRLPLGAEVLRGVSIVVVVVEVVVAVAVEEEEERWWWWW